MALFCPSRGLILDLGGWGFDVPFYFAQDCILHIFMSRWLYYGSYCTPHSFESSNVSAQWRMGRSSSSMPWQAFSAFCLRFLLKLEGFSYDLEMKTREQNRNNKRSKVERFGWFIERIKTGLAFCWLSERSGQKNLMPENF